MRFVVVVLNLVAGMLMALSVVTVLGPDLGSPRRGVVFDALWLAFHVGPLVALAALALVSHRLELPRLPLVLIAVTVFIAVPGVLIAKSDADSAPNHSPGHGALTFLAVCAQYLAAGASWIVSLGIWAARRAKRRRNAEPAAAAVGGSM